MSAYVLSSETMCKENIELIIEDDNTKVTRNLYTVI
jgi:hypothetical protein